MNEKNLIQRLGADYCSQRMQGTLFLYNGDVHEFEYVNDNGKTITAQRHTGTPETSQTEVVNNIPADLFMGWKSLSWPTLGYRQAAGGQVLLTVGRRGSVQRGLHRSTLYVQVHPVTHAAEREFGLDWRFFTQRAPLMLMTMKPTFTPFAEGLAAIMKGTIPSFAVSADFAVAPAEQVEFLEILFRGRRVGEVDASGNVSITAAGILPSWNKAKGN
jgi:hypothetical protein